MSDNHLTLLGSQSSFFTSPDDARLESFPNRGTRPYTITLVFLTLERKGRVASVSRMILRALSTSVP